MDRKDNHTAQTTRVNPRLTHRHSHVAIDPLPTLVMAIEAYTNKAARKSGQGWRLPCPAHDGKDHNLYIGNGDKKLIIKCHSHQCDPKDIVEAVGLTLADIYYDRLTGTALQRHLNDVNTLMIKKELEHELLILLFWLRDSWREVFPRNSKADMPRVKQAFERVAKAILYLSKEGAE